MSNMLWNHFFLLRYKKIVKSCNLIYFAANACPKKIVKSCCFFLQ